MMNTPQKHQLHKHIVSGSALIANYMGETIRKDGKIALKDKEPLTNQCIVDAKYHSSWDWLMPVIESISKQKFEDGDTCYPRTFGMISEEGQFMFRFNRHQLFCADTLIEAAFNAVVDRLQSV